MKIKQFFLYLLGLFAMASLHGSQENTDDIMEKLKSIIEDKDKDYNEFNKIWDKLTNENKDNLLASKPSIIHMAAEHGKPQICSRILDYDKSQLEREDNSDKTPLLVAVQHNKYNTAEIFLKKGCNINKKYNGLPPLFVAAANGDIKMVKILLQYNPSLDGLTNEGVLSYVIKGKHDKVLKALLDYSKNTIKDEEIKNGKTPLILAAQKSSIEIVETLLDHGADPSKTDDNNNNIVHCAAQNKDSKIIAKLLSYDYRKKLDIKSMINAENNKQQTPVLLAAHYGDIERVKTLLETGAKPLQKDRYGNNIVHHAAQNQDHNMMKQLLLYDYSKKFDIKSMINAENNKQQTPVLLAAHDGDIETVKALLDHGADPSKTDDNNNNFLHYCAQNCSFKALEVLLKYPNQKYKTYINAKNKHGETPLIIASKGISKNIVRILLHYEADPTIKDNDGNNALYHAYENSVINDMYLEFSQEIIEDYANAVLNSSHMNRQNNLDLVEDNQITNRHMTIITLLIVFIVMIAYLLRKKVLNLKKQKRYRF